MSGTIEIISEMNTTKTVLTDHAGGISKFENLCVG